MTSLKPKMLSSSTLYFHKALSQPVLGFSNDLTRMNTEMKTSNSQNWSILQQTTVSSILKTYTAVLESHVWNKNEIIQCIKSVIQWLRDHYSFCKYTGNYIYKGHNLQQAPLNFTHKFFFSLPYFSLPQSLLTSMTLVPLGYTFVYCHPSSG